MTATANLLLIEDHRDIAEMVFTYLEQSGYTLDYAADGVTGLHLAVSNTYDLIILDPQVIPLLQFCRHSYRCANGSVRIIIMG